MSDEISIISDMNLIQKGFKRAKTSNWLLIFAFLIVLIADIVYVFFTFSYGIDWATNAESLGINQFWFLLVGISAISTLLQFIALILLANGQKKYSDFTSNIKRPIKVSRIFLIIYLVVLLLVNLLRFALVGIQFELAGNLRGIVAPVVFFIFILLITLGLLFARLAIEKILNEKGSSTKSSFLPYLLFLPLLGEIVAVIFSFIPSLSDYNIYLYLFSLIVFDFFVIILSIDFLFVLKKKEFQTIS